VRQTAGGTRPTHTAQPGAIYRFNIDPAAKERLTKGLDDVGLVLQHIERIEEFEAHYLDEQPWVEVRSP
jgi:3-isopropylmalate dehydratase small subunit